MIDLLATVGKIVIEAGIGAAAEYFLSRKREEEREKREEALLEKEEELVEYMKELLKRQQAQQYEEGAQIAVAPFGELVIDTSKEDAEAA